MAVLHLQKGSKMKPQIDSLGHIYFDRGKQGTLEQIQ